MNDIVQIVTYSLLGLVALAGFIGFLFGLGRGFSKASLRLLFFVVFALFAVVITPYISGMLIEFPVQTDQFSGSISDLIEQSLAQDPMIQSMVSSSTVLQNFIEAAPLLIINLVVYVGLLFTMSSFSWIAYAIFAAIFIKKQKQMPKQKNAQLHVDFRPAKPKKYRLFGGIVGAAHSILFLVLALLPVTGFISIASNLANSTEGNIAYAAAGEATPTASLIDDYMPEQVRLILNAYNNSPLAIASKYSGADSFLFDSLTTIQIEDQNGEKMNISYRSEIYDLAKIYDNVAFLIDYDYDNFVFEELDYDKLQIAVDTVLDSKLIKAIIPDLLEWAASDLNLPEEERYLDINLEQTYVTIINQIVDEYRAQGGVYNGLVNDFGNIFEVFKTLGENGIIDDAMQPQINVDTIKNKLLANNRQVLNNVLDYSMITALKPVLIYGVNTQLDALTQSQDISDLNRVVFTHVDNSEVDWTAFSAELKNIVNKLVDIYLSVESSFTDNLIDVISDDPMELININFEVITPKIGEIMSIMQETSLLVDQNGNKVQYLQFMDYLNNSFAGEYVDFNEFKVLGAWEREIDNLTDILVAVKDSGIMALVTNNLDDLSTIDFNQIIEMLAQEADNNETYIHNIIQPILDSIAFKKTLITGVDMLNDLIEENQSVLGATVILDKIQAQAMFVESEKIQVLAFFDNVVLYAKDLDISNIADDPFTAILESEFATLGSVLDSIKQNDMFGAYEENDIQYVGLYNSLFLALNNNPTYSQFANFEVATENNFSWNSELSLIQSAITAMQDITINYGGEDKNLIQAIMDGEDLTQILNVLTNNDIDALINPLVSSRLLSKNVVLIVNTVNNELASILGTTIPEVLVDTDLSSQSTEITNVLKEIIALYPNISGGFDSNDLETLAGSFGTLLNTIKVNATRIEDDGVFKNTYTSLIAYITDDVAMGVIGEKLGYILDQYISDADVNWEDLLDLAVDAQNLTATSSIGIELSSKFSDIIATMYQGEIYGEITLDVVDILNMFITITTSSSDQDVLDLTSDALNILALSQNQYVLDELGTKEEYAEKVDTVLEFFKGLTGITQFDTLIGMQDYEAESNAIQDVSDALDLINGSTNIEDFETLVDALADSTLIMNLLEENEIQIDIDPAYQAQIQDYIENETGLDQATIDALLQILGLN